MSIFDDIGDAFSDAGNAVANVATDAANTVADGAGVAVTAVADGAVATGNGIADGGKMALQGVQDVASGDAFFPDNPHRESRCKELAADLGQINYRLVADNEQVKRNLEGLNASIADLYYAKGLPVPAIAEVASVDYHQTAYEVSEMTAPLLAVGAVRYALTDTAIIAEVETGEIAGEAGAAALSAEGLGFGPGLVIAAAVTSLIGAIEGAEKRDKLQSYIRDAVRLRLRLKQAELLDMRLVNALAGASAAVSNLTQLDYSEAQINVAIERILAAARQALNVDVSQEAAQQLAQLDQSRGSWTNED